MRLRRGLTALFAASGLVLLPALPANATGASGTPDDLIQQIKTSADPFATLDGFSDSQQNQVETWLKQADENQVNELFSNASDADESSPSLSPRNGKYTDLGISILEKAECVISVDLASCNKAAKDAKTATSSAEKNFAASTLHNGKGDAYRHCYWNARMTVHIGSSGAMKIASNHEAIRGGPAKEKKMDLANNKTGRSVGAKQKTVKKSQAQCKSLANKGKLKTLK